MYQLRSSTAVARTWLCLRWYPCQARIQRGSLRQARRRWLALQEQRPRKNEMPFALSVSSIVDDEATGIVGSDKQSKSRYTTSALLCPDHESKREQSGIVDCHLLSQACCHSGAISLAARIAFDRSSPDVQGFLEVRAANDGSFSDT